MKTMGRSICIMIAACILHAMSASAVEKADVSSGISSFLDEDMIRYALGESGLHGSLAEMETYLNSSGVAHYVELYEKTQTGYVFD